MTKKRKNFSIMLTQTIQQRKKETRGQIDIYKGS